MKLESHHMFNEVFTLYADEKEIYHTIVKETILKNNRCTKLSTSQISEMTGIPRSSVWHDLNKLEKRKLITIEREEKTNIICINIEYEEYYEE